VGIISTNYPEEQLTEEQFNAIQALIMEAIFRDRKGDVKPWFYDQRRREGCSA